MGKKERVAAIKAVKHLRAKDAQREEKQKTAVKEEETEAKPTDGARPADGAKPTAKEMRLEKKRKKIQKVANRQKQIDAVKSKMAKKAANEADVKEREAKVKEVGKQVLKEILEGISQPGAQDKGLPFVPPNYTRTHKSLLGSYKKFVQTQSHAIKIVEGPTPDFFVIRAANSTEPYPSGVKLLEKISSPESLSEKWVKSLERAWDEYCKSVPKADQSLERFTKSLPESIRNTRKGQAPSKRKKGEKKRARPTEGDTEPPKKVEGTAEEAAETPAEVKTEVKTEEPPKKKKKAKA